ncbi:hypothetical protein ACEPPN_011208 [Leptodophora sp. 'Broadleaf-Isolate-01']
MDDSMPQDEYFEWEDIILYRAPCEVTTENGKECHQTLEYRRAFTHTFDDSESDTDDFQWADGTTRRERSASSSTTSIQTSFTFKSFRDSEKKDSPIDFPSYEGIESDPASSYEGIDIGLGGIETATPIVGEIAFSEPPTTPKKVDAIPTFERPTVPETRDCAALCLQPCGNVNYLLHQWREDDVSASWKHLVTKRKTWGDISELDHSSWKRHNTVARLENASWRTWSKLRFGLRTVNPKTINWLKHCDDTCLYGPFSVSSRSSLPQSSSPSSSTSRAVRSPRSKSDSCSTTPTSILKKPSIADILRRGSLPTYTLSSSSSSFSHTSLQGCPLSDSSPLTHLQTAHTHAEFTTPLPTLTTPCQTTKSSKKNVKFLSEVRQYVIVNPIGDRKIHRTVKKTRSTTLEEDAYFLTPEPESEVDVASEPSHWSPDSLWSYNSNQTQAQTQTQSQNQTSIRSQSANEGRTKDAEWTWLGVVGEEEIETDYFSSKPIYAQSHQSTVAGTPYPYPLPYQSSYSQSSTASSSPLDIGKGSLSYYYGNSHSQTRSQTNFSGSVTPDIEIETETEVEVEVDDPIDYLLSCTEGSDSESLGLGVGSCSPSSSSSSGSSEGSDEQGSSGSEESSDDESTVPDFVARSGASIGDAKISAGNLGVTRGFDMGLGMGVQRGMGMGIGIGIVDDEKHRLYEQVMEEFNLEY